MKNERWPAYNDFAWTESIIALPEECKGEAEFYVNLIRDNIRDNSGNKAETLLHFGSGAGAHDFIFKRYFNVTGVDLSFGMIEIAEKRNPEITYHHGDMRNVILDKTFDAVAISDCVGYMTTAEDLRTAVDNASRHMKPGGVLVITANLLEEFRNNNFVYSGSLDGTDLTLFENNHVVEPAGADHALYEAAMVYLIRREGKLSIHSDIHTLGLFSRRVWVSLLDDAGFTV